MTGLRVKDYSSESMKKVYKLKETCHLTVKTKTLSKRDNMKQTTKDYSIEKINFRTEE